MSNKNPKIDFLSSDTYRTAYAKQYINLLPIKIIRVIIYVLGLLLYIYLAINLLTNLQTPDGIISILCIVLSVILFIGMIDIYITFHLEGKPKVGLPEAFESSDTSINLAEYLDTNSVGMILIQAIKLQKKYNLNKIDPLLVFLAFSKDRIGQQILLRCEIYFDNNSEKQFIQMCKENINNSQSVNIFTEELKQILIDAMKLAIKGKREFADFGDLCMALGEKNTTVKKILNDKSLKSEDLSDIVSWYRRLIEYSKKQYFWQKKYYGCGVGQDWASGYTPILNYFSKDISEFLLDVKLQAIASGHKQVIDRIEEILVKSGQNNVMLIGDEGVGKRTLVNAFAQKVIRGQALFSLRYKHVIELDTSQLLAGASEAELQQRFVRIFAEATNAGNIILFINNFDNLVNPEIEQLGTVDASQFLIPYLKSDKLQIIATSNYNGWHKKIEQNQTLANLFTKVDVIEPKISEMMPVLEDVVGQFEVKNRVMFSHNALKAIIKLADRYIHNEVFPQKAIDLVQALSAKYNLGNQIKIITSKEVEDYISTRFKVPATEATKEEKKKLLNLEQELHERIIDQEEAVKLIANSLRRARAGLAKKNKPIGSFLFIGPTGVGKTETAKALADIYFGSEKNMIRFDMSEFQQISSVERLIGSENAKGKAGQGRLSVAIKENPYTVLLFDEIEKAHSNILNLFLQMLDEGFITDATGRKLDFTNAIIICTSNAGAEEIRQYIKSEKLLDKLSNYILDYLQKKALFRPEFLNRFDAVVCYRPLLPEHIFAIAKLMIKKLQKTMKQKEIKLQITEPAIKKLAELGYDPTLGARPMARVIQEKVENLLATKMLKEEVSKGQSVVIDEKDII